MSSQCLQSVKAHTYVVRLIHDDVALEAIPFKLNVKHFKTKDFVYIIEQSSNNGKCVLQLSTASLSNAEWELVFQMRVKTGLTPSSLQIVDKTVVQFLPTSNKIWFEIIDNIKFITIELRTINEFNLICPKFDQGDILLHLQDDSYIRTYKSLLSQASETLHEVISKNPTINCLDLQNISKQSIIRFLYQLYPNRRSIEESFQELAEASVALSSRMFIQKLSEHLCSPSFKPSSLLERLRISLNLRLIPAIREIVYKLVKNGEWDKIIEQNPTFIQSFPMEVYNTLVAPILAQKSLNATKLKLVVDLFSQTAASNPQNRRIILLETAFFVDRGVLNVHGTGGFEVASDGSLIAKFSRLMQRECALAQSTPGEVLRFLITQMYPGGQPIPIRLERAALVFCFDHKWVKMLQIIEQSHMRSPCTSKTEFYLHLTLADELGLRNMIRSCMLHAEGSCNQYAQQLIHSHDFSKLSENTRRHLVDRTYCGWSITDFSEKPIADPLAIRIPSHRKEREIGNGRGGPKGFENDQTTDTEMTDNLKKTHSSLYLYT